MSLTPEQIAAGWWLHDGSGVCPIKDDRTVHQIMEECGWTSRGAAGRKAWCWRPVVAYRIIEAHGADAAPARPTPFPADYSELVFDDAGWSQTIIVDGKRPEWLRDDDQTSAFADDGQSGTDASLREWMHNIAIRVRRREPKRETVECCLQTHRDGLFIKSCHGTIDLIDGKPDLSTLKTAEDVL